MLPATSAECQFLGQADSDSELEYYNSLFCNKVVCSIFLCTAAIRNHRFKKTRAGTNKVPHNSSAYSRDNTNKNKFMKKLHFSPFLDPSLRPSEASIDLTPNLEPLHPLIMSQHEAFFDNIKELGELTVSSTSAVDSKINCYKQFKFNNKNPRSLRIK
jgi:hypothetical protein